MADRRSSGREQRDAILAAVEQFHTESGTWPTRAQTSALAGISVSNLRHHVDTLVEAGLVLRGPGGTIQIVREGGEPLIPALTTTLDALILGAVETVHARTSGPVTVREIALEIARHRHVLSRRCAYLVSAGRLVRVQTGYRIPDAEK